MTDHELMASLKLGDTTALEELIDRHRAAAVAYARLMLGDDGLAEDVAQEAFARVYLARQQYQASYTFRTWLMTMVRNLCIDQLRRNKDQTASLEQMKHPAEICTATERTDQAIIGEDTQRRLNRAMDRLPDTQRRMLLLRSEGKSLDEIAEICGANKTSTKTMISAARRSLLKMMKS